MTETKPLALVTGASSGIGFELARQFAQRGYDVVINAEDTQIDTAAAKVRAEGTEVIPIRADLRTPDGIAQLWSQVQALGRPLEAAALNAGVGRGGAFVDTDWADDLEVMQLNVVSTAAMLKLVLVEMTGRNSGRVLVTSSIASTMPGPYQPVYNASKSFVQSLTEAVQQELKDSAVTVTALMPGATDTDFFSRADLDDTAIGQSSKDDPADVAKQGLDALMAGKDKVLASSLKTKVQGAANKVLPDAFKSSAHEAMAKPRD
ncbi:SDR family NAD(P)-dependent oxidoreductase [Modestobacter roseus]|uniref:Short-subunit dehydrogenase n=1 Tax=Modestobacter roseus TaxID=1181884 RepID=A0A562ISL8_9ACTN|nr:SDR family NAD(P)-dependent oxidoreductase [Modestobacter roseus]MQA35315.1 SDR family NAD(P)-dependent oxidoreductase [Modestobacter roseus]TWH73554.1 short-subunit dehydrogenase [Modestobacter roseus]